MSVIPISSGIVVLSGDEPEAELHPIVITSSNSIINKNEAKSRPIGWSVSENIGIAVINPRAVSKLIKEK